MIEEREVRLDRIVSGWVAPLLGRLAQDRPAIITREIAAGYLHEVGLHRDPSAVIRYLSRLGWLAPTKVRGAWAYFPPGQTTTGDPYIDLRGWQAIDTTAQFALAGEAAALHLGYLDRQSEGPVTVWMPAQQRPPAGLRPHLRVVHLTFPDGTDVGPSRPLLRRRGLDVYAWANGMPAFGPEALLVQLAVRPGSFGPWADLAAHLTAFVDDCEPDRVVRLLDGQSASSWQRAAYLLDAGGATKTAEAVMNRRLPGKLIHVTLGDGHSDLAASRYRVTDHLLAPLLASVSKA